MKKLLFLLTAISVAVSMWAAPVDQATAQRKAQQYLTSKMIAGQIMAPTSLNPVLVKTEYGTGKTKAPVYYIFNTSTTYLVMSADDRAEEILMIGDAPLDMDNIPDGMQYLLDCYKEELSYLIDRPNLKVEKSTESPMLSAVTYGPLLTCNWDQDSPYNKQCKFTYNGTTYTCATGCPATSAAMVMYYWRYPPSVGAQAEYTYTLDISSTSTSNEVSFTYPALEATTFDWNNMRDNYGYYYNESGVLQYSSYSTAQGNAVAKLMRYVGQAEHMGYGVTASGISNFNAGIIATMFKAWGYKSSCKKVNKSSYGANAWANLIIAEMAASRPVVYLGVDATQGGHAFNVDGYRDSDSKYHVNFGWSGYGNGWFAMNAFTDPDNATFNQSQMAIIGIESPNGEPDLPYFEVNPTSLSFTAEVGETVTKTFTVSGGNLVNNITLSFSGNAAFTISPTTITPAQAAAGQTVTVTYKPTSAGTQSAAIGVNCEGLTTQTVTLSGTSTGGSSVPTLTVNPASLTFNTSVGTPVTQTFLVTGANLTASYATLSVSGSGFSIDKTMVTRTALQGGGSTITVTYNPTSSGTHTGTVTIQSTGAETKTVTLTGTATGSPTITVNPTSLSFNTELGTSVTKTFNVSGSDLTGNISLAVSGTGFSINKTTISQNDATNGTTVTVTYNPTTGGTHSGTVTLTSAGATAKTVALTGVATTTPELTVNPTSLSFNTEVGTPVTKTFNLSGVYLTGAVNLAVSGTGFSIDKTSVTVSEATNGTTVTVTYNPTAAGTHTGTVNITSNGAQAVTVTLNGTATEPVRVITANPTTLNFSALVGETKTATFTVTGQNLTGPLTLSVNNNIYSVQPTTISVAEATAGKTVTVTYAPTAFGITSGTVTISGGGAPSVTVTLNGQADIVKYAPVMLPANEDYINLTSFRADWTDETPAANVASYTLEVSPKEVEPVVELLGSIDGTSYTNQSYQAVTLAAPWSGENVYGGYGAIYFRNATHQSATTDGYIKYTVPAGYQNATFTVKLTTASGQYGSGRFVVGSTQTAAVEYNISATETHSWLVTGSAGEVITITSPEDQYSPDIALIEVYAGNATTMLAATSDADYRLITGITDKFYTVDNLTAEGTFLYRVKALYIDNTESDWSNIEEVTLFDNTPAYVRGDVNGDTHVTMDDLTVLINYLLVNTTPINVMGAATCSGVDNTDVNMDDLTALINYLLAGAWSN